MANLAVAEPLEVGQDLPYAALIDPHGQFSLEQAVEKLEQQHLNEHTNFSRGYAQETFWLKFEIPAYAFNGKDRWLEVGPNFIDDIQLFARPIGNNINSKQGSKDASDTTWILKKTGDIIGSQSDLNYRNSVFILPAIPNGVTAYEVFIRLQSSSTLIFYASLWKPSVFMEHAAKSTAFWAFYFGLAALSSLLALVLAVVLGGTLLWSAVAFSTAFVLVAAIEGYISWLIPIFGISLQHHLTSVMTLTSYAAILWLSSEAISLRQQLPRVYKFMITLSVMKLLLIVLIPMGQYHVAIIIQSFFHLLGTVTFIYCIFYLWWRSSFNKTVLATGVVPVICIGGSLFGMFPVLGLVAFQQELYVIWQYSVIALILLVISIAVYRIKQQNLRELEKSQLASQLKIERDASFHQRQFIGVVSHEFRTPLAVIMGSLVNLFYLEKDKNSARLLRYNKIRRATDRLILLTDNCLADARLSADNLYLDQQPVNFFDLVSSATELVTLSNTHYLRLTVDGKIPEDHTTPSSTVCVDAALLRIALSNIIDNAVKHSKGGCIHVDCATADKLAIVRIFDQGQGIEEESAEWIFERYRRGAHVRRGSGLGLYIAREITLAHGGDLILASTSSRGSCFELTFNLAIENLRS